MNILKLLLALVFVLATSGAVFADVNIDIDCQEPANGLISCTIYAYGARTILLTGDFPAHQANHFTQNNPPLMEQTLLLQDLANELDFIKTVDTHWMFNIRDLLPTTSNYENFASYSETNDRSNPVNLTDPYGGFFTFGVGKFNSASGKYFALDEPLYGPLVQIVAPLTSDTIIPIVHVLGEDTVHIEVIYDVMPEPGTAFMLIAGGLCLLGARPRRISRRMA